MKKLMLLVLLAVGLTSLMATAAEPLARITSDTVTLAAGVTNAAKDVWLLTGDDTAMITPAGSVKTGAGQVRAILYSGSSTVTNWSFTLYAYDGAVKKSLYAASSTTAAPSSGRADLLSTNVIFSGRVRAEVFLNYATNTASSFAVSTIVE